MIPPYVALVMAVSVAFCVAVWITVGHLIRRAQR